MCETSSPLSVRDSVKASALLAVKCIRVIVVFALFATMESSIDVQCCQNLLNNDIRLSACGLHFDSDVHFPFSSHHQNENGFHSARNKMKDDYE